MNDRQTTPEAPGPKRKRERPERLNISSKTLRDLQPVPGRDYIQFDAKVSRFGVRVKANGLRTYVFQYTNRYGQQRRYTIAKVGEMTPEAAKEEARKLRVRVRNGEDPSADRKADRRALTVAELCDEYLRLGLRTRKRRKAGQSGQIKASTLRGDRSRIGAHIKPLLGSRAVASLTREDMVELVSAVEQGKTARKVERLLSGSPPRGGPIAAARTLTLIAAILERAVERGLIDKNPARGVAKAADGKRMPLFDYDRVTRLGATLREMEAEGETSLGLRILRLLLLTGCRRNEIESLQRKTVDFSAGCLSFADTKSGPQNRIVGEPALALVRSFLPLHGKPDDYLFPSAGKVGYFQALPQLWARVAKRAGLDGMTIHDLRHWFASAAAGMGYTELIIAKLLGHVAPGITARYANPHNAAVRPAADRIAGVLAAHLEGRPMGEVVPFAAA